MNLDKNNLMDIVSSRLADYRMKQPKAEALNLIVSEVVAGVIEQLKEELTLGSDLTVAIEYLEENML